VETRERGSDQKCKNESDCLSCQLSRAKKPTGRRAGFYWTVGGGISAGHLGLSHYPAALKSSRSVGTDQEKVILRKHTAKRGHGGGGEGGAYGSHASHTVG